MSGEERIAILAAVEACEPFTTTMQLRDHLWDQGGELSRDQLYRRLSALEREGMVEKEISHGGNGIGTAIWTLARGSR